MFTKVDERLWSDENYMKLSDDGKLLFLYVLSCSHRNMIGLYPLPVPYGSFDLNWSPERFTKGLKELLSKGFINYNFKTHIIFIKNFLKYNPLENPNQVKGAIKALDTIPTNAIDAELVDYLRTVEKPFIEPLVKLLEKGLGKQEDEDVYEDEDVEEDEAKNSHIDFFENIWSLYPSKKGKGRVSDSRKKDLLKIGDELKRCISRYVADVGKRRNSGFKDLEYQNGGTFFNSGYIDYLDSNYLGEEKRERDVPLKLIIRDEL